MALPIPVRTCYFPPMRVKRLEIQGFKSFKDKTVVHFDHTITGIVGPNGCGKSNIVDAFFWVMGEQSYKHMRGNSSDDLIFNGSSKYSALGMAEATLVMETDVPDTEHAPAGATAQDIPVHLKTKEISVTRRLYRSGEGEYFINNVPARLKDIHELFMDTGVGTKGYSVIEQGQIGKIVNAKPEERRQIIEDAAGIAKYKARKKESIRKMESAEANLMRLADVIQEIERNLGSLERQAQKARQYKKCKDELFDKEITWGRRKAKVLSAQMEILKQRKERLEEELVSFRAELNTVENGLEVDRIAQLTESKKAEDLQLHIQSVSSELSSEKSARELSRHRQDDLAQQLQKLLEEKTELAEAVLTEQEGLSAKTASQAELEQNLVGVRSKTQIFGEKVSDLRREVEKARQQMERLQRELMIEMQKASEVSSRAAGLQSRVESGTEQLTRLGQTIADLGNKKTQLEVSTQENTARSEECAKQLQSMQAEQLIQRGRLETSQQKTKQAEQKKNEAQRVALQMRSKLQSLEELAEAYEGLSDGPKALMDWIKKNGKGNQFEILSDLLDVTAGNEEAVEGWLDRGLEGFLTHDPVTAYAALSELRVKKQGRAEIQIADAGAEAAPQIARADAAKVIAALKKAGFEVAGKLSEFVQVRVSKRGFKFSELAESLMSGAIVVESMDPSPGFLTANGIAALQGWSLVSKSGDVLDARGILRGGKSEAATSSEMVLQRKRSIADLGMQVAQADEVLSAAEKILQTELAEQEEAELKLEETRTEIQQLTIQSAAATREAQMAQRTLEEISERLSRTEDDSNRLKGEVDRAEQERTSIQAGLTEMTERQGVLESQRVESEVQLREKEAVLRDEEIALQTARVEESGLQARIEGIRKEIEGIRRLITDRERRQGEITRTLDRVQQEREQHSGGDSFLDEKIAQLTQQLGQQQREWSGSKDQLEQFSSRINQALERIKELHQSGDRKVAEVNQFAVDAEKLNGEMGFLMQNLEEKYGPGCLQQTSVAEQTEMEAPVITAAISEEEEKQLAEEVERIRERIRRLGEVNTAAIEEYEEVKKRYDHLLTEKADLERSIRDLKDAIEHINATSEDRFKRAFQAIAERFERLFPIIFGGGSARLSLVFPEGSTDILEAGVDILAQPPGKKVANITLLSGGEKALTAVSLIFAVFMVKPSPFCILDEVDAPLDDANVGKFNALLREMSVKSQFILITHNKKTMELNDTLYGVTMEEPGVSKVISIEMQ